MTLADAAATERLARAIAPHLAAGDLVGLSGGLGAGKSTFARALIAARLAALGRAEDIPSPSYTLVQTYDLGPRTASSSGTPTSTGSRRPARSPSSASRTPSPPRSPSSNGPSASGPRSPPAA